MATTPKNLHSDALSLIRAAKNLLQEEPAIFASVEECNYFRNIYRSSKKIPLNKPCVSPPIAALPSSKSERSSAPEKIDSSATPPLMGDGIALECAVQKTTIEASAQKEEKIAIPPFITPIAPLEPKQTDLPPPITSIDEGFTELRKLLSKIVPGFPYVSEIPSDAKAQQMAQRWITKNQSAPISLLYLREPSEQQKFLTNLTMALDLFFGPARLINAEGIEKENQWESFLSVPDLKLVIICDYALWQMPHLLQFYREVPQQALRFLQNKPLMLLPDLTLYLKDPQLKRSLWKALCQKIGSL